MTSLCFLVIKVIFQKNDIVSHTKEPISFFFCIWFMQTDFSMSWDIHHKVSPHAPILKCYSSLLSCEKKKNYSVRLHRPCLLLILAQFFKVLDLLIHSFLSWGVTSELLSRNTFLSWQCTYSCWYMAGYCNYSPIKII